MAKRSLTFSFAFLVPIILQDSLSPPIGTKSTRRVTNTKKESTLTSLEGELTPFATAPSKLKTVLSARSSGSHPLQADSKHRPTFKGDMSATQHPVDPLGRCILGAHTSAAGGSWNAITEGKTIGASGVQLFTANQRQWISKEIPQSDAKKFCETMSTTGVTVNMSHGSYLVNLGSTKPELLEKSRATFKQEIERCHRLGIRFLVFHPGSAADSTVDATLTRIADSLIQLKDLINQGPTHVLIESTAGQGEQTGHDFAHLRFLMDALVPHIPNIGICVDTCHMFAAGYDIRTEEAFNASFKNFDEVVGLKYLQAFHVNDSLTPLNSRVDRHAMLGEGHIGWLAFKLLMTDPMTKDVPKYLETPGDLDVWTREIEQLRGFVNGAELPPNKPSPNMKQEAGKFKKAKSDVKAPKKSAAVKEDGEDGEEAPKTKKRKPALAKSESMSESKPKKKKTKLDDEDGDGDYQPCSHE